MVDLRREFEDILNEYGNDMLLVRNDRKQVCTCVDTLYMTPKKQCPICLGTGYVNTVERVSGRAVVASIPETLPRSIVTAEPINILVSKQQFYIKHNIRPSRKDLVILCKWNGNKPIFDEYTSIYEINEVEPLMADGGRTEYFIAYANSDPINADAILHNITINSNRLTYYVTVNKQ